MTRHIVSGWKVGTELSIIMLFSLSPPHKLHGKVKTTDDLFVINLLKSLKGFNYNICSFQVFETSICSKVEVYMSRLYKHHFLSFLLQKAEMELKKNQNYKPETGKLSAPLM